MPEAFARCVVCDQLKVDQFELLVAINGRCYESGEVPADVLRDGFCNHHGWMAAQIADPGTASRVFAQLLRRYVSQPAVSSPCYVCRYLHEREERYLRALPGHSASAVACVPHLQHWLALEGSFSALTECPRIWESTAAELEQRLQQHQLWRYGRDPVLLQTVQLTLGRRGLCNFYSFR